MMVLQVALTALAVLAGAIAVPILCRRFYYAHIEPLRIDLRTALATAVIGLLFLWGVSRYGHIKAASIKGSDY